MKDNPHFPAPLIPLDLIKNKICELELAITEAIHGSRQSRLVRDGIVGDLRLLLRTQADYVRSVCQGDAAKLESSGFALAKKPEKPGIPNAPVIKAAIMTGIEGQVKLRWEGQKSARMYQVWMTDTDPTDSAVWQVVGVTTKISTLIDNLESYKAYWFSVSAISSAGEGAKSNPTIGRAA